MSDVAQRPQDSGGALDEATHRVKEAASVAQEKAGELGAQGRSSLQAQIDERRTRAGSQARSIAHALRESGRSLREEGNDGPARLTEQAGERLEQLGDYLERMDGDALLRDVERFARGRPWTVAGLGMVVGLAASRLLKASAERRHGDARRALPSAPPAHAGHGHALAEPADDPLTRDLESRVRR